MRDGRSYFFNFFTTKNRKEFYDNLVVKINSVNIELKIDEEKESKTNYYYLYDHSYVDIIFIDEPKLDFEKFEYTLKYSKNEITNFNYLLLVNKFGSRSYNDINQYLIFPLLYMDLKKTRKRDLSKPICLNKAEDFDFSEEYLYKYKTNFDSMGYHFNNHYTTMAYVLYYLMRIIPFTYSQIKLQSGHFDVPSRMFTSLENLLYVFSVSDENRELVPDFFYFYESLLNLNYNNFGFTNKIQVHHFNTNQNVGIVEFIIDLRKILETVELSPWINNIFGYNQLNEDYKSFNKFPQYSYEQYNNFTIEKENLYSKLGEDEITPELKRDINDQIKDIRSRIQLLTLGLTPSQLFKSSHPFKEKNNRKQTNNFILKENSKDNKVHKKSKFLGRKISNPCRINNNMIEFIKTNPSFKDLLFIFHNKDNEHSKIIFLFENEINIFNFIIENDKDLPCKKIILDEEINLIKIKPYKNIFIELYNNYYLLCRLVNRTLLLFSETEKYFIEWPCIVTAIEFYSHDEIEANLNTKIHLNKVIIGDEEGHLSLIEIETEFNEKKKEFKINSLTNINKRNKAFYSYINGIIYNKQLNIIISYNNEGYISINNGFSFEILNIIEINNSPNILDIKLSKYNLLYIYTKITNKININNYRLYCYTLNGIKVSQLSEKEEYINYFVNDYGVNIFYKNGNLNQYNYATLKQIESNYDKEDLDLIKKNKEIFFCIDNSKMQNVFIIYDKDSKIIKINNEI